LSKATADPAVEVLVLTGSGGLFLAGADIKEIASGLANKSPTLRELQAQMEALTKPIVAAIQGVALGGRFELALTCHWRMAASDAKVGLPEVKLGILPGAGGTQRFTRAIVGVGPGGTDPRPRQLATARDLMQQIAP
jgi:3-hydroxyacyl-CoA dehydrogenase